MDNEPYIPPKISFFKFILKYLQKNINITFMIIISLILPGFLIADYMHLLEYASKSNPADATVKDKKFIKGQEGRKDVYRVTYAYTSADGEIVRTTGYIGKYAWEELKEGDILKIRYEKNRHAESKIWDKSLLLSPFSYELKDCLFQFIITPLFFIQALWLLSILKKDKDYIQPLFLNGKTGFGEITELDLHKDKRAPYYNVTYKFKIENGKTFFGKFQYLNRYESKLHPQTGDQGSVMYMEKDPEKNIWIGSQWLDALSIARRMKFKSYREGKKETQTAD